MNKWDDFVLALTKVECLRLAKETAFEEWGGDIPRTLLFSMLGRTIAEKFDELSPDERSFVFDVIERGMQTSAADLRSLVATGLLEALQTRASRNALLLGRMEEQLGDLSRKYLLEWGLWSRQ